jgi:hypothetical protein
MATLNNFFRANTADGSILTQVINVVTANGDGADRGRFLPAKEVLITEDFANVDPDGGTIEDGNIFNNVLALTAATSGAGAGDRGKLYLLIEVLSTTGAGVFVAQLNNDTANPGTAIYNRLSTAGANLVLPIQVDTNFTVADAVQNIVVGNVTLSTETELYVTAYYEAID